MEQSNYNTENLVPSSQRTPQQRSQQAKNAGKASGQSRRKRKAFKEVFKTLLASELSPKLAEAINDKSGALGIDTLGFTVNDYMALAQVVKAVSGDTKAFEIIRDTVGEKPIEKQQVTNINKEKNLLDDVLRQLGEGNEQT
ncbi:MAG: hypothetical protein RR198_05105 [Oscillospiraceae bacterium]